MFVQKTYLCGVIFIVFCIFLAALYLNDKMRSQIEFVRKIRTRYMLGKDV